MVFDTVGRDEDGNLGEFFYRLTSEPSHVEQTQSTVATRCEGINEEVSCVT